jgi:hypothetical protein
MFAAMAANAENGGMIDALHAMPGFRSPFPERVR